MSENGKTNTTQVLARPRIRRRGGQPGNSNAKVAIPGLSTLERRIRDLRRRANAAMARVPV